MSKKGGYTNRRSFRQYEVFFLEEFVSDQKDYALEGYIKIVTFIDVSLRLLTENWRRRRFKRSPSIR